MSDLPISVWALVMLGVIGLPAVTCVVLYRKAMSVGLGARTAVAVAIGAAAVLGGWLGISAALAGAGVYGQEPGEYRPWLGVAFVAVLAALLLASRIPVIARILNGPDTPAWLALPHTVRVAGVLFLLVLAEGQLPAVFALPAALGDIAVGLSAPFVARRLFRDTGHQTGRRTGHRRAVWFNILGIVDLAAAVSIGFLAGLGPFRPLEVTPSTEPLGLLPLVLVATVAVPLALALHVVSLRGLRIAPQPQDRREDPVPVPG